MAKPLWRSFGYPRANDQTQQHPFHRRWHRAQRLQRLVRGLWPGSVDSIDDGGTNLTGRAAKGSERSSDAFVYWNWPSWRWSFPRQVSGRDENRRSRTGKGVPGRESRAERHRQALNRSRLRSGTPAATVRWRFAGGHRRIRPSHRLFQRSQFASRARRGPPSGNRCSHRARRRAPPADTPITDRERSARSTQWRSRIPVRLWGMLGSLVFASRRICSEPCGSQNRPGGVRFCVRRRDTHRLNIRHRARFAIFPYVRF